MLKEIKKATQEFKLPLSGKYYVEFLDEILSIQNSKEAYQAILPLVKRRVNINGFKPRTYQEANFILPQLEIINNAYENALFSQIKNSDKKSFQPREILDDFLIPLLNNYKNKLDEEQRKIFNNGKHLLNALYPENFGTTAAIRSFWFNYLGNLFPNDKIFQTKPDPFTVYLNFHELGVKPVYYQKKDFRIDIPIYNGENEEFYLGCWSPGKGYLIKEGHLKEQSCDDRKPLENGQLMVNNKTNVQDKPYLYSPSRQKSSL